jgi:ethanolamine ammonia-lyase small subunit
MDASMLPAPQPDPVPAVMQRIRARTPARILTGRAGLSYLTATQLELRRDHAAAVDAVHAELDLHRDFGGPFVERWNLFEVQTQAATKSEYLLRPDFGRKLNDAGRTQLARQCPRGVDLQVVIGDGLSTAAVVAQAPSLLRLLDNGVRAKGWSFGRPFLVRHCRVGILNDIGELLDPAVAVLLIGERPGLATAESLSAYLAYRPRPGHTDAQRNLISNIHARGVSTETATQRILDLAEKMRVLQTSGVAVKEDLPGPSEARVELIVPQERSSNSPESR